MSFDLGSAHGSVLIDVNAAIKSLEKAKRSLVDFEGQAAATSAKVQRSFTDIGKSLQKVGAGMSLAITAPAVLAAREAIGAASDLVEAQTAVNTIFEAGAASVQEFASTASTALGLSRTAALNAAVGYAGMGKAAGLAGQELADFSEQLVINAADLASFFNQDPGEMLDKLRAGLAGEAEPLRRFGIDLTETNVAATAFRLGIAETGAELTQQQKVLARYAVIQEQMGAAMGDRARTADQFAGSLRTLQASAGDLAAEMGKALLPAMSVAVKVLTEAVRALNGMPEPLRNATIAVAALAAVAGPLAVGIGALAIGMSALSAATIAGTPALVALAAVLGPLTALLAGGVVVTILANGIIETRNAAEEAKDPVDSLTESIIKLGDASADVAQQEAADKVADSWALAAEKARAAQEAIDAAATAPGGDVSIESRTGAGATSEETAQQLIDNSEAAKEAEQQYGRLALTTGELAEVERILGNLRRSTHPDRVAFNRQADEAVQAFLREETGADDLLKRLRDLNAGNSNLSGSIASLTDETNANADATNDASEVVRRLTSDEEALASGMTVDALLARKEATRDYWEGLVAAEEAVKALQRAENDPLHAGMGFPGPATGADVRDIAQDEIRIDIERARQAEQDAQRRADLEEQTADEIERINEDLVSTLDSLNDQREANARDLHRSLVTLERDTAQQMRQLDGQIAQAREQASEQLAGVAEQRADNEEQLQQGLVDAAESANKSFADLAEQRVETQQNAAEQIVEAEKSANEALAALAERRRDLQESTTESLADSQEQADEALAALVSRQAEIQTTLRESLTTAQEQYNEALENIAKAQADVRENLGEQLSDLSENWREQGRELDRQATEIRARIRASLREMDREWDKINNKNLREQRALRGEMQDTLAQNALTAQQLQEDLERIKADPTFTAGEKADAQFRTERALQGLALDRQLAERDAARDIADLEEERLDQQREYEAERQTQVQQAQRDLRDLNRRRMEGEKDYHERRMELEEAAAERIAELNGQRQEAVERLGEAEADAYKTAGDALDDLAAQRTAILNDQAEREADIRKDAREAAQDLADDEVEIAQDLADRRRTIAEELQGRLGDIAKQEADVANTLAQRQQDLRDTAAKREQDLADDEEKIHQDLGKRLAEIEHERSIVVRNEARERELILREHRNEAERIAKEQGQAETDALVAKREERKALFEQLDKEDLLDATERGRGVGDAYGAGEIAGLNAKQPQVRVAGVALGQAVITGANESLDNIRIAGENMALALKEGLDSKTKEIEDSGKKAAAAAEKGAKEEAEIGSPSKVWQNIGLTMRQSLAAELANGDEPANAARSAIRRASQAATDEFKRRRVLDGGWTTVAEQAHVRRQQDAVAQRDGRAAAAALPPIHITLELDGRVLDERIVDVSVGGLRNAIARNPLRRRR